MEKETSSTYNNSENMNEYSVLLNIFQGVLDSETKVQDSNGIKVTANINLYRGLDVGIKDKFIIESVYELDKKIVVLTNSDKNVCGIFSLIKHNENSNKYYMVANKEDLYLGNIDNKNFYLYFCLYTVAGKKSFMDRMSLRNCNETLLSNLNALRVPVNISVNDIETTEETLCIDFGTSNTTSGCFLGRNYVKTISDNGIYNGNIVLEDINFVDFIDNGDEKRKTRRVFPTMVYVKDCLNPNDIKYYFGYSANGIIKDFDYCPKATIIYGIKRWVTSMEEYEEINDEDGNIAQVKRRDIIRAYIKHIIEYAENQFKCKFKNIHISSPVKLKEQFLIAFKEILPEYNLEVNDALDEAVSVLYNTISDKIDKRKFKSNEGSKALIIDCGGGTTDLASCSFSIAEGDFSWKVNINTSFKNGDVNFGGNNITYRIMQFMKIIYANYYSKNSGRVDIDTLIKYPSGNIFRVVDDHGTKVIYDEFEKEYMRCEDIIPTRYKEYVVKTQEERNMVRNNFFFLWEIAEEMKKQFFSKTNIMRNKFDDKDPNNGDSDLNVTKLNKWALSISQDGKLKKINDFPEVTFNINQINKLIKADIYNVIKKFLEDLYDDDKLLEYKIIKLTGQSCRIDTFKEALKEFVPGKSIDFKQNYNDDRELYDISEQELELKLACLRGVIRYFKAKKSGDIEVNIKNEAPIIPYCVTVFDFKGEEQQLIENNVNTEEKAKGILKPLSTDEFELFLKDKKGTDGKTIKNYKYINDSSLFKDTSIDNIVEESNNKVTQEDVDTIRDNSVKFYVYPDRSSWGFYVLPVARNNSRLKLGIKKYYTFEEDLSTVTFFDGTR